MSEVFFKRDDLVGKEVIDSKAMRTGKVKDIAFGLAEKMALVVQTNENAEKIIPIDHVAAVGDVILLAPEEAHPAAQPPAAAFQPQQAPQAAMRVAPSPAPPAAQAVGGTACPNCGSDNRSGAKFCHRCGARLG